MGLSADLKAGVASAKAAVAELQEPLVWIRATGENMGRVDGIVQQSHRISQNAKGDANVRAGYLVTVLGAMDGAQLGDTLTVDGRTRRIVGVRGPREGEGERLVTTLDVASHGPKFDPAFFTDIVNIDSQIGIAKNFSNRHESRAAVQLTSRAEAVEGGLIEVENVRSRIVFPGATDIKVGDRVILPESYNNLYIHVANVDRVFNPDDRAVDHIVVTW